MKYVETLVTFQEIPDEITLCINISNCPIHCKGCHSSHLWEDIGDILNKNSLAKLIANNIGITCISFMGGDQDPAYINDLAYWIKSNLLLKVAWYSGKQSLPNEINLEFFDFIKLGSYIEELGPLNSKTTNQRFYKVNNEVLEDITYKFWK